MQNRSATISFKTWGARRPIPSDAHRQKRVGDWAQRSSAQNRQSSKDNEKRRGRVSKTIGTVLKI